MVNVIVVMRKRIVYAWKMKNRFLLNLKGKEKNIYEELAKILDNYKDTETFSNEFVVEGTLEKPIVSIKYPGRKMVRIDTRRLNSARYGNLFDFLVVAHKEGEENISDFTFVKILHDFEKYKRQSEDFWAALKEIYYKNNIPDKIPKLDGINPLLFLSVIKWIWIQEDFNYKMRWDEVKSPTRYRLISKRGRTIGRGAGRGKSFGAMVLLKNGFSIEEVKKIISIYG